MITFKEWLIIENKIIQATIMINVPDVQQSENFDCGPCCLKSIAKYFNVGPKTEEEFIEICGTSKKDGTHPNQLQKTAEKLGLKAKFYTGLTIESLKSYIDQRKPVIVEIQAWGDPKKYKKLNDGHFVIAIGYDDENIYFEDPSLVRVRGYLSYDEFDSRWQEKETNGDYFYHDGLVIYSKKEKRKTTILNKAEHID